MQRGGSGDIPVAELVAPILFSTILITMILGALSVATLFLTFFPTDGYRRWLSGRAGTLYTTSPARNSPETAVS